MAGAGSSAHPEAREADGTTLSTGVHTLEPELLNPQVRGFSPSSNHSCVI